MWPPIQPLHVPSAVVSSNGTPVTRVCTATRSMRIYLSRLHDLSHCSDASLALTASRARLRAHPIAHYPQRLNFGMPDILMISITPHPSADRVVSATHGDIRRGGGALPLMRRACLLYFTPDLPNA